MIEKGSFIIDTKEQRVNKILFLHRNNFWSSCHSKGVILQIFILQRIILCSWRISWTLAWSWNHADYWTFSNLWKYCNQGYKTSLDKDQMTFMKCKLNTKSTGAQVILKPKSVILREEGGLGFLIIMRAQHEVLQIEVLLSRGRQCS